MRNQYFVGLFSFIVFCGIISGCIFQKKPVVVDPCSSAPTECFVRPGEINVDPNSIPACVELIKCHAWEMSAI